jgi:hypothetical protein
VGDCARSHVAIGRVAADAHNLPVLEATRGNVEVKLLANGKPVEGGYELLPGYIPSGGWANQYRIAEKLIFDEYSAL